MEIVDKVEEAETEVAEAEAKLSAAKTEAIEEAIEETAECAVRAESTAEMAAIVAQDAHGRINETESELERHEESDQWLRTEVERLKAEVDELRSMISMQSSEAVSLSIPPISHEPPIAEVSQEVPVAPEAMESSSTEMEASLKSADENPAPKARARHRLV